MDGTESRIPDNSRVKLRGYVDSTFYDGMAKTGNEGWVRKHRLDIHGLPEIFIEWDREHWADNMQPNRWTYEEHFDVIEEGNPMDDITPEDLELFKKFRAMMKGEEPDTAEAQAEVVDVEAEVDAEQRQHFAGQVSRTHGLLENCEAFFFVGVQRHEDDEAPQGVLTIGTAYSSMSPESDALIGMQLSNMASKFHTEAALTIIHHLTSDGDDDGLDS